MALCETNAFYPEPADIKEKIDDMVNAGSRYINIEKRLGLGAALVLGTNVPESM